MVSKQEYRSIQERILELMHEAGPSVDPVDLVDLMRQEGISRELAATVMWEMVAAGYISRSRDWRLSPERESTREIELHA